MNYFKAQDVMTVTKIFHCKLPIQNFNEGTQHKISAPSENDVIDINKMDQSVITSSKKKMERLAMLQTKPWDNTKLLRW